MQDRLAATLAFDASVSALTGVSSGRAAAFLRLGIETVRDLVQHYPRRYIDMTRLDTIEHAPLGERVTIIGEVHEVVLKRPRRDLSLVEVTVVDGTGTLIVTFFKQPWLQRSIRQGMRVGVSGELEFNYGYKRMKSPFLDVIDEGGPMLAGSIIPVHGATEKVSAGIMRKVIRAALASIQGCFDPLPLRLRTRYRLMSRAAALASIHFPQTADDIAQAKRRLAYEELLLLEMHLLASARSFTQGKAAHVHVFDGPFSRALSAALPFSLTDDQLRAVADIQGRMATDSAMSHLLLGDVGTGKTIVAAFAAAAAADARAQTLMMAPTEVLASQYARALGPGASISSSTDVTEAPGDDAAEGAEPAAVGQNVTIKDGVGTVRANVQSRPYTGNTTPNDLVETKNMTIGTFNASGLKAGPSGTTSAPQMQRAV